MAFFYPPPPPPPSASYAPPVPHEPQGSTGDQPPRRQVGAVLAMAMFVAAWPTPQTLPPRGQQTAWFPSVITFVPGGRAGALYPAILLAHQDAQVEVEAVASGTLAPETSDQPPRQSALSPASLGILQRPWVPTWDAQTGPKTAAWHVAPILVVIPRVPPPPAVLLAWIPPFIAPPRPVAVAPLTLVYGAAPPTQFPLAPATLQRVASAWISTWDAQRGPKNAAWHVPPSLVLIPRTVLPGAVLTANERPWVGPPRPVAIAPSTLVYGAAPPPRGPLAQQTMMDIASSWAQNWGAQQGHAFTEGIAPPPVVFNPFWAVQTNVGIGGILP